MPSINKIRFTNVIYEDGMKRYNDETFRFDGFNGALVLENGGGKTVFIQTALQAILPHKTLSERKIDQTLQLDDYPAHIAIEWLLSESPRRYVMTCVSLFLVQNKLNSYRYVYPYIAGNPNGIESIPFVREGTNRPSDRGEIAEYYQQMTQQHLNAETFSTIKAFQQHIEEHYHIIQSEWEAIVRINSGEGGIEAFFDECRQTRQLLDRLLIPTVERAISGHSEHGFADTFEKQRDSFKQYKHLKRQITENQHIEEHLTSYVKTVGHLDEREQNYTERKQEAKAVTRLLQLQKEENNQASNRLEEDWHRLHHDTSTLEKKRLSIVLRREEETLYADAKRSKEAERAKASIEQEHIRIKQEYHSLQLARLDFQLKEEQEQLAFFEDALGRIDQEEEALDIKQQFDRSSAELAGYYQFEMEKVLDEKQAHDAEHDSLEKAMNVLKTKISDRRLVYTEEKTQFDQATGIIELQRRELVKKQRRLLANPEQETVRDQMQHWIDRTNRLDEDTVQLQTEQKRLRERIVSDEHDLQKEMHLKEKLGRVLAALDEKRSQLDQHKSAVLEILAPLHTSFTLIDTIYLKQETLKQRIVDELHMLYHSREDSFLDERRAHRFKDDHADQETFFADPTIERRLPKWNHQIGMVETGMKYLRSLDEGERRHALTYPLWAMTLITLRTHKISVENKLKQLQTKLQFPIIVLSTEEARAIVKGETIDSTIVAPNHWKDNEDELSFKKWKKRIEDYAVATRQKREAYEQSIKIWEQAQGKLNDFLAIYPYEIFESYRDGQIEARRSFEASQVRQVVLQDTLETAKNQLEAQSDRIRHQISERDGLVSKIEDGQSYIRQEQEMQDSVVLQDETQRRMLAIESEMSSMQREEAMLKQRILLIDERRRMLEEAIRGLNRERDEQGLSTMEVIITDLTKRVLLDRREALQRRLDGFSESRRTLEIQIDNKQTVIRDKTRTRSQLYEEQTADMFIRGFRFPPDGDNRLMILLPEMKLLEERKQKAVEQFQEAEQHHRQQAYQVDIKRDEFMKKFVDTEPLIFTDALSTVESQLTTEERRLTKRRLYLKQEEDRIMKEGRSIDQAQRHLEKFEHSHRFTGPSIVVSVMTMEEEKRFLYAREAYIQEIIMRLHNAEENVAQEKQNVDQAKESFRAFCKSEITNVKMQEMARQGIERKQSYTEIQAFHDLMKARIRTAIKYCDESIMQHDRMLEQYVLHIHNHLRTVVEELALIPRKTKVKVDDKWKDIYKFTIPEWTEEEGKRRIRNRIDEIIEELEVGIKSGRFQNADGQENIGMIRSQIETWMHSKQLLQTVMDGKEIRVACRKVTNDNHVSTKSYSWDESNAWSGGEKWSKNMALFLGILSYTAEKKKHEVPNMRRYRSVIIDNPFGKASSDHVLGPVFFIAEQLGFQIIALTAHAEGKFLRDYFPVIYSCRLRQAIDTNRQIMTTEKYINSAFFKDNETIPLEHIGVMEQLDLC